MRLVDDINLETIASGPIAEIFDDHARVIDFPVGRAIDLHNIERASLANLCTGCTFTTWLWRRSFVTVQTTGQNPGGCGLADSSDTGEEKRVCHSAASQRLVKCLCDMFLADQFCESIGAPFPGEYEMMSGR